MNDDMEEDFKKLNEDAERARKLILEMFNLNNIPFNAALLGCIAVIKIIQDGADLDDDQVIQLMKVVEVKKASS